MPSGLRGLFAADGYTINSLAARALDGHVDHLALHKQAAALAAPDFFFGILHAKTPCG